MLHLPHDERPDAPPHGGGDDGAGARLSRDRHATRNDTRGSRSLLVEECVATLNRMNKGGKKQGTTARIAHQ